MARELSARSIPLGRPLSVVEVTTSTNDDAKLAARSGATEGAAFIADAQTSGRGRLGRSWHSPPGENLYASWVLRPTLSPASVPPLTLAVGLAVADVLEERLPSSSVRIKWPNDVLVDGRKVAGVLLEAQMMGPSIENVVIGVGINVRSRVFPPELADRATSLALAGATNLSRGELFVMLCAALSRRIEVLEKDGLARLVHEISSRDALAGRGVEIVVIAGTAAGIDESGMLRVRFADGRERSCAAGEVLLKET
jgi:BirA family biotin operon repressor/biotin-[acetyl-CoA-carboxylase] ligase